ncbi:hypothetical protein HispidOSU_007711, partial [Sigmodon hispidus]
NKLDSSIAAYDSWIMPLTLSSLKEIFFRVEQPGLKHQLDSGVYPEVAAMTMDIAALRGPNYAGESTSQRQWYSDNYSDL